MQKTTWLTGALALLGSLGATAAVTQPGEAHERREKDAARISARATALLKQMTLEEKVGQLVQMFYFGSKSVETMIGKGEVGSILFVTDPKQINRLQRIAVEQSRLHIPLLIGFDVIHGLRTVFPVPIALASSWDPAMVEAVQASAAAEARAVGIHWTFAPMVDIARDVRWGRIVEGAGEDPFLGAAMAAAQVRGFQGGRRVHPGHVIAGVKHFAGYGAAAGGRDYDEVNLSLSELWNVYFPPFKAAVEAGAGNVMSAYMGLNGVPAAGNRWLLHDVLRTTWGFDGFVVSDANAVHNLTTHGFAADGPDAAVRAMTAGVDMEMTAIKPDYASLVDAVKDGKVSLRTIDAATRRILDAKIGLGLFENPYVDETNAAAVLAAPEHRVQARIAAERSAVLLRNEGRTLPLSRATLRSIAVIGPLADSKRDMLGPWVFDHDLNETVTVVQGLRDGLSDAVRVEFAEGVQMPPRKYPSPFEVLDKSPKQKRWPEEQRSAEFAKAEAAARAADMIVAVLGQSQEMSGEAASVSSLELPGEQQRLLETLVATGKPVVLVLMSGRPLDITWAATHVPAILQVWYPGTRGGAAVANLLFGDALPGGKLPITWPRSVGQLPLFYAHTLSHEPSNATKRYWNEDGQPLYPFGFGLSYSAFTISEPRLQRKAVRLGEAVNLSVDVRNTGERAGDEVVQLYIHQRTGRALRPIRELKGFQRIMLAPNESKTVAFTLPAETLRYWSTADGAWVQDASIFDAWIGADSTTPNHVEFEVLKGSH